ncbi:hypothetical protein ACFPRL_24915 [Pseudoclavibacter helvolus]
MGAARFLAVKADRAEDHANGTCRRGTAAGEESPVCDALARPACTAGGCD